MSSRLHPGIVPALARAIALGMALLAALAFAGLHQASARSVWCAGDPTIIVNGNPVSITVSVPLDELWNIDDVTVTYHIPVNARVDAVLNTGILFPEKTVVVSDQPAVYGLIAVSRIPVDVVVHHHGAVFDIRATQVALGGTRLWLDGDSDTPLHTMTYGLLNLRLF